MDQIVGTPKRRRRPGTKYIWMLSALSAVSALLYWEQTALLYVISTLLVTGLLLVVAFSDLEARDRELNQAEPNPAIRPESSVMTGTSSPAVADPPATKRRKGAA